MSNPFEKPPTKNIERTINCPKCNGSKKIDGKDCPRCGGKGYIVDKPR